MSQTEHNDHEAIQDVKQLGLFAAIASLGYVFWIVGGMEMIERLAYYGVRAVSGLYVTAPVSEGGLGVSAEELGTIFFVWALFQSLVPALIGGLSDRLGYKLTIFISTVVKIAAYLIMAFYPSFAGFTIGAIVLATGTGIFKPGIQGTLVKATNRRNSSMAWGIFYQTVNIGGWLGPLLAAQLRQLLRLDAAPGAHKKGTQVGAQLFERGGQRQRRVEMPSGAPTRENHNRPDGRRPLRFTTLSLTTLRYRR